MKNAWLKNEMFIFMHHLDFIACSLVLLELEGMQRGGFGKAIVGFFMLVVGMRWMKKLCVFSKHVVYQSTFCLPCWHDMF